MLSSLTGAPTVLLTTSCTSALELSALLLGIEPGDEVLLPSFTFVSTANAFCLRGAVPVFTDIDPATMCMDPASAAQLVSPRTRAIVPVHYAGVPCDMDAILALARRHGLRVVEDAAQAIGATRDGRHLGTEGDLGTLSFHETKNVVCGEGGALLVNDPALAERALILREKGTNRAQFLQGAVDKYTWVDVGSSFLCSDMLAAMLCAQLEEIEEVTRRRRRLWALYREELSDLEGQGAIVLPDPGRFEEANGHIFWFLCADSQQRRRLIDFLKQRGISAAFHYVPLHLSPMGRRFGGRNGQLPATEDLADRLVRMPLWAGLDEDDARGVADAVREFYRS